MMLLWFCALGVASPMPVFPTVDASRDLDFVQRHLCHEIIESHVPLPFESCLIRRTSISSTCTQMSTCCLPRTCLCHLPCFHRECVHRLLMDTLFRDVKDGCTKLGHVLLELVAILHELMFFLFESTCFVRVLGFLVGGTLRTLVILLWVSTSFRLVGTPIRESLSSSCGLPGRKGFALLLLFLTCTFTSWISIAA